MNFNGIITGAIGGFLSAVVVDINAWRHSAQQGKIPDFDWRLAISRWVSGAVLGAIAGLGIGISI